MSDKTLFRSRELGELVEEAMKMGWKVEPHRNQNLKWTVPGGSAFILTGKRVGDRRAVENIKRDMRRALASASPSLATPNQEKTLTAKPFVDLGANVAATMAIKKTVEQFKEKEQKKEEPKVEHKPTDAVRTDAGMPEIDLFEAVDKTVELIKSKNITSSDAAREILAKYRIPKRKGDGYVVSVAGITNLLLKFHPEYRQRNRGPLSVKRDGDRVTVTHDAKQSLPAQHPPAPAPSIPKPLVVPFAQHPIPSIAAVQAAHVPAPPPAQQDVAQSSQLKPKDPSNLNEQMRAVLDMNLPEEKRKKLLRALLED